MVAAAATEDMNNAASFASKFFKCALFRGKKKILKRDSFGLKFDELQEERKREREKER